MAHRPASPAVLMAAAVARQVYAGVQVLRCRSVAQPKVACSGAGSSPGHPRPEHRTSPLGRGRSVIAAAMRRCGDQRLARAACSRAWRHSGYCPCATTQLGSAVTRLLAGRGGRARKRILLDRTQPHPEAARRARRRGGVCLTHPSDAALRAQDMIRRWGAASRYKAPLPLAGSAEGRKADLAAARWASARRCRRTSGRSPRTPSPAAVVGVHHLARRTAWMPRPARRCRDQVDRR